MAQVRKRNRVLTVSKEALPSFLERGYDQVDEKGRIIKRATGGRLVPLKEYNQLLEENERLKQELQASKKTKKATK